MGNFETDLAALINIGKRQLPENTRQLQAQNAIRLLELEKEGYVLTEEQKNFFHALAVEAVMHPEVKKGFFK